MVTLINLWPVELFRNWFLFGRFYDLCFRGVLARMQRKLGTSGHHASLIKVLVANIKVAGDRSRSPDPHGNIFDFWFYKDLGFFYFFGLLLSVFGCLNYIMRSDNLDPLIIHVLGFLQDLESH